MRARRPRGVDLLPLLDVMMTVTFTFATIREVQLGEASADTAAVTSKVASLEASAAQAVLSATEATATIARLEFERQAEADARKKAEAERNRLEQARAELERRLAAAAREGEVLREKAYAGSDGERVDSVLMQLLKRNSVLEIEIVGVLGAAGGVPENRCCFRTDPRSSTWRSCGAMPTLAGELDEWARTDAAGLFEALEETKGGNALAIVRQAGSATYKSGEKLERYVRGRVSERTVYIEERGLDMPARACGATP